MNTPISDWTSTPYLTGHGNGLMNVHVPNLQCLHLSFLSVHPHTTAVSPTIKAGSQPRMRSEKTSECGVCQIVAGETVPHEHRATVSGCYLVRFSYSPTFYRLDLHTHKSSCCTSKSRMKHQTAKTALKIGPPY